VALFNRVESASNIAEPYKMQDKNEALLARNMNYSRLTAWYGDDGKLYSSLSVFL